MHLHSFIRFKWGKLRSMFLAAHSKDVSKSLRYNHNKIQKNTFRNAHTHALTHVHTHLRHTNMVQWIENETHLPSENENTSPTNLSWMHKATTPCCIIVKMLSNHRTQNYFVKWHTVNHMRIALTGVNWVHTYAFKAEPKNFRQFQHRQPWFDGLFLVYLMRIERYG